MKPIDPVNRLKSYDFGNDKRIDDLYAYVPLAKTPVARALKRFQWKKLNGPVVVSFTPLNKTEPIIIKGILDYCDVFSSSVYLKRECGIAFNKVLLRFKGETQTRLENGEESPIKIADSRLYHQAGNSVTVPVIERIAKSMMIILKGEKFDEQEVLINI